MNTMLQPPYTITPLIAERFAANLFSSHLGIELLHCTNGVAICQLPIVPSLLQNVQFVHGGVLATLADVAMGFAASSAVGEGQHVLTGDLRISYLNPATGPVLVAEGKAIKTGRKIIFTEASIWQGETLIARASASMVVVPAADVTAR